MKRLVRLMVATGCLFGVLSLTSTALAATTITATVGPVAVPAVPLQICVVQTDAGVNECVTGPAAQTVTLTVVVTLGDVTPVVVPPTITPAQCPAGTQGVALNVNTGSVGGTITGSVTVIVNGQPVTIPINQTVVGPNQTITVFACAGVTPGLPGLPALPGL